jgi:predicted nucleic acid-binding protein
MNFCEKAETSAEAMILYIDTSVILRILFQQTPTLKQWANWTRAYTSELMGVEARRTIDRLRLAKEINDAQVATAHGSLMKIEKMLDIVILNRPVLNRAAKPMATSLKTLDALHLATALLLQEQREPALVFATHDSAQSTAARALGFTVIGIDEE